MLTGSEYLESPAKRRFDTALATILKPALFAARLGAQATFGYHVYEDERVGRDRQLVRVPKIETLAHDGRPFNATAELYRRKALDELEQIQLIESGEMSAIGSRHLLPADYERMRQVAQETNRGRELLQQHDEDVMPFKRGLLSTFALHAHIFSDQDVEQRLALDIQDYTRASIFYDMRLVTRATRAVALNELQNGENPIELP
jgi:lipopolysaccharide/colanic/teichoic acid biosynthesis glycosyltransferase